MQIIEYINLTLDRLRADGKESAAAKYSKLLGPLRQFMSSQGVEDVNITSLADQKFTDTFANFLVNDYPALQKMSTISGNNAEKHLATLSTMARKAMKDGYLPKKRAAGCKGSVADRVTRLPRPIGSTTTSNGRRTAALSHVTEFMKVADTFARLIGDENDSMAMNKEDSTLRKIKEKSLAIALLSMTLGGRSVREICTLRARDYRDEKISLAFTDGTLRLSPAARFIVERFRTENADEGDYLLRFVSARDNAEAQGSRIATIEKNVLATLSEIGISSEYVENPGVYWSMLATEAGASSALVNRILVGRDSGEAVDAESLQQVLGKVSVLCDSLFDGWFAVKCVAGNGEKIATSVVDDGLLDQSEIYVPKQIKAHVKDGRTVYENERILDNLFFFRATMARAESVQKCLKLKGVIYGSYRNGKKVFAVIPETQIRNMQIFLGNYDPRRVVFDPDKQYVGRRVRVTDGLFKGCEGVIADVKTHSDTGGEQLVKYFVVQIRGVIAFATQKIEDGLLEEIV